MSAHLELSGPGKDTRRSQLWINRPLSSIELEGDLITRSGDTRLGRELPASRLSATRRDLLDWLADRIHATQRPHPTRVAIDGVDAAGKTMLADELVEPLAARGRPVIRASIDVFHHARAHRYRRGTDSPEGYFLDSFDHDAILTNLLRPLGPGGSRRLRTAVFEHCADRPSNARQRTARRRAVLVFDGVFLMLPVAQSPLLSARPPEWVGEEPVIPSWSLHRAWSEEVSRCKT